MRVQSCDTGSQWKGKSQREPGGKRVIMKGFLEEVPETTICKSLRAEGIKASIPGEKGKTEE